MATKQKALFTDTRKKPKSIPPWILEKVRVWTMGKVDSWARIKKEAIGVNIFQGNKVVLWWSDYKKVAAINGALNDQVILYPYCKWPYVIYTVISDDAKGT